MGVSDLPRLRDYLKGPMSNWTQREDPAAHPGRPYRWSRLSPPDSYSRARPFGSHKYTFPVYSTAPVATAPSPGFTQGEQDPMLRAPATSGRTREGSKMSLWNRVYLAPNWVSQTLCLAHPQILLIAWQAGTAHSIAVR